MRFTKVLLVLVPLKLVWIRITSSKWSQAFFWTALAHCLLQLGLEAYAFTNNYRAINRLYSIIDAGDGKIDSGSFGIAVYQDNQLSVCEGLPSPETCQVVWTQSEGTLGYSDEPTSVKPTVATTTIPEATIASPTASTLPPPEKDTTSAPVDNSSDEVDEDDEDSDDEDSDDSDEDDEDSDDDESPAVKREFLPTYRPSGQFLGALIGEEDSPNDTFLARPECIASLHVPLQTLLNAQRVDVTFLSYQLWVFGMSFVAILNESVPHIMAAFLTHIVATLWSSYQVYLTHEFRSSFKRLVIEGPCKSNILADYWTPRDESEITILTLNCIVTAIVGFLSYKLLKAFGWQTFKKIGASFDINRCYRLVLAFSIVIQLAVFFVGANVALWLDQLCSGFIAPFAEHKHIYEAVYITALVLLIPWLAIGWYSVRKESRLWMSIFLGIAVLMITGWASMFASRVFRWTFRAWDFFAFMTVAAAVLLAAAICIGAVCRINFGRGLPEYLVREELGAEPAWEPAMEKTYGDEEKLVEFPSETSPHPIPTFSDAFIGPEGLDRLRAMSRPAARSGPGIGMHARGTSTSGSVDFGLIGLPARPDAARTISRSASAASRSTVASGADRMIPTDPRMNLVRINTSDTIRSYSSQKSSASRLKGQRWEIDE